MVTFTTFTFLLRFSGYINSCDARTTTAAWSLPFFPSADPRQEHDPRRDVAADDLHPARGERAAEPADVQHSTVRRLRQPVPALLTRATAREPSDELADRAAGDHVQGKSAGVAIR